MNVQIMSDAGFCSIFKINGVVSCVTTNHTAKTIAEEMVFAKKLHGYSHSRINRAIPVSEEELFRIQIEMTDSMTGTLLWKPEGKSFCPIDYCKIQGNSCLFPVQIKDYSEKYGMEISQIVYADLPIFGLQDIRTKSRTHYFKFVAENAGLKLIAYRNDDSGCVEIPISKIYIKPNLL